MVPSPQVTKPSLICTSHLSHECYTQYHFTSPVWSPCFWWIAHIYEAQQQTCSPSSRPCLTFCNIPVFYGELISPCPTPKLKDYPLAAVNLLNKGNCVQDHFMSQVFIFFHGMSPSFWATASLSFTKAYNVFYWKGTGQRETLFLTIQSYHH